MAHSRKFLTVGALGVAALALIGTGAGATFTDAVHATQSVTAGMLNMSVSSPGGTTSTDGKTVTFAAVGPVSSTFSTTQHVTLTQTGNIHGSAVTLHASDANSNTVLRDQLFVTIDSNVGRAYNGPLTGLENTPINLGGLDVATADITFYAGGPGAPSLTNEAQGGTVIPIITLDYTG